MIATDALSNSLSERLIVARARNVPVVWHDVAAIGFEEAVRVQWKVIEALGPVGAWKIGLKADTGLSTHAPLPASLLFPSGTVLRGPQWQMRGIEAEVAIRLGRDLVPEDGSAHDATLHAAVDAMLPVIEVVETRLASWEAAPAPLKLADLQSFGALILGDPRPAVPDFDPGKVQARVCFDGRVTAAALGGNPTGAIATLLRLLARQTANAPSRPKAGDIVTTGSCTGMPFAPPDSHVQATIVDLGNVEVRFG